MVPSQENSDQLVPFVKNKAKSDPVLSALLLARLHWYVLYTYTPTLSLTHTLSLSFLWASTQGFLKRQERTHIGEKPFKSTMCGKSFSESGYLKRNLKGTKLERKHLSATNVTGFFNIDQRRHTGERNHFGAPNVTITERIIIGAQQVHKVYYELLHIVRFLENTGEYTQEGWEALQVYNVS